MTCILPLGNDSLTDSRYDRQTRFGPVGSEGQQRLLNSSVLIIGVGALGTVVAELLARAGVGHLRLADRDTIELSNLQRQALFSEADVGMAKVEAAQQHLQNINSHVTVEPLAVDVTAANIISLANEIDLIVDGTDNFETRFLVNDLALERSIPWVHGGCVGAAGQSFAFWPGETICLRCLVPNPPGPEAVETCDTAGVLGPATHLIASLQAMSALRLLVQGKAGLDDRLIAIDSWRRQFHTISTRDLDSSACPACTQGRRDFLRSTSKIEPIKLCGRNAVQLHPSSQDTKIDFSRLEARWDQLGKITRNRFLIRLKPDPIHTITVFCDGRVLIEGTTDIPHAKSIHARYVGA